MQLNGKKVIWIGDINIDQRNLTGLQFRKLDISMKIFGMIQVVTDVADHTETVSYLRVPLM